MVAIVSPSIEHKPHAAAVAVYWRRREWKRFLRGHFPKGRHSRRRMVRKTRINQTYHWVTDRGYGELGVVGKMRPGGTSGMEKTGENGSRATKNRSASAEFCYFLSPDFD